MYDRLVDIGIIYREHQSDYDCAAYIPDICGDLTMVNVTLKLHWQSNFGADPRAFALPDKMVDLLDVQYQYLYLYSPDYFHEADVYVVIGFAKSFVDEQWSILQRQWLNKTFYDFLRYDRFVEVRVVDMKLGYQLPALPENSKSSGSREWVIWILVAVVLVVLLCIGGSICFRRHRRRHACLSEEDKESLLDTHNSSVHH